MIPERVVLAGVCRGTGSGTECTRVAFGESRGISGSSGLGGTRTDGAVFLGLLNRRTRSSGERLLARPAIAPTRHAIASSDSSRQSNETSSARAALLLAVDASVAASGVETAGVGVICSGAPSTAVGAPQSAKHAHSTCNEVCPGGIHPDGVRMIRFPRPGRSYTEQRTLLDSVTGHSA